MLYKLVSRRNWFIREEERGVQDVVERDIMRIEEILPRKYQESVMEGGRPKDKFREHIKSDGKNQYSTR